MQTRISVKKAALQQSAKQSEVISEKATTKILAENVKEDQKRQKQSPKYLEKDKKPLKPIIQQELQKKKAENLYIDSKSVSNQSCQNNCQPNLSFDDDQNSFDSSRPRKRINKSNLSLQDDFDDQQLQNEQEFTAGQMSEKHLRHKTTKMPQSSSREKRLEERKPNKQLDEAEQYENEEQISQGNENSDACDPIEEEDESDDYRNKEIAIKKFAQEKRELEKNQKPSKFLQCCYCPKEYSSSRNLWDYKVTKHPFKLLEYYGQGYLCQYCYKNYHEENLCQKKPDQKKPQMKTSYQKHLDDLFDQVKNIKASSNNSQKKQSAKILKKPICKK